MANETTSSTLSELYTEIVAEALFVAQEASVLRNLVTNYNITGQGKEISVPIYAAVSAAAVAEATDLSNTAVNPTEATFTASEHGVMTTLTDLGASTALEMLQQTLVNCLEMLLLKEWTKTSLLYLMVLAQ